MDRGQKQHNRRLELHEKLCEILGSKNVYFDPPNGLMMNYPCIVYKKSGNSTLHADNKPYFVKRQYDVTTISRDPDNNIGDQIAQMLHCGYSTSFVKDNLHHDVYKLYY